MSTRKLSSLYSSSFQNFGYGSSTPSPFMDINVQRMPSNLKGLFPLLEYYARTDSVIKPIIEKVSEYTIMPLNYSDIENSERRKLVENILEEILDIFNFIIGMNKDLNTFGNSFASISYPFKRFFICKKCRNRSLSDAISEYEYKNGHFFFPCPKCGDKGSPKEYGDLRIKNHKGLKLIRWRPHDIEIIVNPFNGEKKYYYKPSTEMISRIRRADRFVLDTTPKNAIEFIKSNKHVQFHQDQIFHMYRPRISSFEETSLGWGESLIIAALSHAYLKKVYSKATEVSAIIRSSPMGIIYPETNASGGALGNPLASIDIKAFQSHMQEEIVRHRRDPGYIMTSSHPVGQQVMFGDSKAFSYQQEMNYQDESILQSLGFPREFLTGGLQFTGSSISLRILENQLTKQYFLANDFIQWIMKRVNDLIYVGDEKIEMKRFRMADDLQMIQIQLQQAESGNLSRDRVLSSIFDVDPKKEMDLIKKEDEIKSESLRKRIVIEASAQVEAEEIRQKGQAKIQASMPAYLAKAEADLANKNPQFAHFIQERNQIAVQQAMQQQQQDINQQIAIKQQQQDRLSMESVEETEQMQNALAEDQQKKMTLRSNLINGVADGKIQASVIFNVTSSNPAALMDIYNILKDSIQAEADPGRKERLTLAVSFLEERINSRQK